MTIQELNQKLHNLNAENSRERVLEFSFALLGWMGIASNGEDKPQLLATKTQTLSGYLAPAPMTTQPQLYRLSADGQNIRIRFAVLKKFKKSYINQLVDNDPGLASYQASMKGIVQVPGREPYISTQPYYIHFVTTPDYDRLTLIYNQGDQKRIITFRNRLTHTQYNRIIEQWKSIANKSKPEIAELFWKSLDIVEINKEFYVKIKERFDALLGIARLSKITADDNQAKQFAIRFIGRYIFCWFLKEKGIIPSSIIGVEIIRKTDNFYQGILQKLFFDTLNTKVEERNPLTYEKAFEKIPYLNGGLFDESEEDRIFRELNVQHWLINFVDILENYDFTVDESSEAYQQVAVDPEMLGRIFENLLASQNPETEKAVANERKANGAFYTPRPIVSYMVDESLKTYLAGELKIEEKELDPVFAAQPQWPEKLNKRKTDADTALKNLKILDPACGSGAFPMGVLQRLVDIRELTSLQPDAYLLKKDILSNNIYGVDIMPMAVEIARLRAWLSLIVDEEYKPEKAKNNFGLDALPNLDFKFMQGNSLLETYEGIKLFDDKLLEGLSSTRQDRILEKTQKKIKELQKEYTTLHNDNNLKGTPKAILEKELKEYKDLLNKISKVNEPDTVYGSLFKGEPKAHNIAEKLKELHKELFGVVDKERKKELKAEIESLEWELIAASLMEQGKEDKIEGLKKLRHQNIKPYFLYKLNFPEVFTEKGGFDIVIGNPPYVQMQKDEGKLADLYKNAKYATFERTGDLYALFYELGFNILKLDGVLCFITSSQWMKANYGKSLRRLFMSKNPQKLVILGPGVFESAVVDTNILVAKNEENLRQLTGSIIDKQDQIIQLRTNGFQPIPYVSEESWAILDAANQDIKQKIESKGKPLSEWNININRGLLTGLNEAFIIDEAKRNELIKADKKSAEIIHPVMKGKEVQKYYVDWKDDYIIFIPWHFPDQNDQTIKGASQPSETKFKKNYLSIYSYLESHKEALKNRNKTETGIRYEWYALQRCAATYLEEFSKEKIIWKRIGSQLRFSYSDEEIYCLDSTCIATGEKIKYLTAILNSTLIKNQLFNNAPRTGMGDLIISVQALEPLYVHYPNAKEEKAIVKLLDQILTIKKTKPNQITLELERQIDELVYKMYDLTYQEVKIVDPDFWLSEEAYEKIKIID